MSKALYIKFVRGAVKDHMEIRLMNQHTKELEVYGYTFEKDTAYNRKNANEKCPYIGDILVDLVETNYIDNVNIYYEGYDLSLNKSMSRQETEKIFDELLAEI